MRTSGKIPFRPGKRLSWLRICLYLTFLAGALLGRAAPVCMKPEVWQNICGMVADAFSVQSGYGFRELYGTVLAAYLTVDAILIFCVFSVFSAPLSFLAVLACGVGAGAGLTALMASFGMNGALFLVCAVVPGLTAAFCVYMAQAEAVVVCSRALFRSLGHSVGPDKSIFREFGRKTLINILLLAFCALYYAVMRLYVILPPAV